MDTLEKTNALHEMATKEILDLVCPSYQTITDDGLAYTFRIMDFTPELAEVFLTRNVNNRPISKNNKNFLVREIRHGNWTFNAEPIIFDDNGNVINGQHRFLAIIESGIPIRVLVIYGLNADVFSKLDTGRKRQGGDVLAMHGVNNYAVVASAIKHAVQFNNGSYGETGSASRILSNQDMLDFYDSNVEIEESAIVGTRLYKSCNKILTPSMITAFHFLLSKRSKIDANVFLNKLCTGVGLEIDSPITALRNKLIRSSNDTRYRLVQSEIVRYTILAWNKYRKGERAKSLKLTTEKVITIE